MSYSDTSNIQNSLNGQMASREVGESEAKLISDVSMFQLAVEIQNAKDAQIERLLADQTEEVDEINKRSLFVAELVQKLLIERNKEEKHADLSEYDDLINEYKEIHHPKTGYIDPFYGMDTRKVELRDLDRTIADLQEVMHRDANELQRIGRDNEFAVHLYTTITEMMTRQKPDENKTMIRNQRTGG